MINFRFVHVCSVVFVLVTSVNRAETSANADACSYSRVRRPSVSFALASSMTRGDASAISDRCNKFPCRFVHTFCCVCASF